MNQPILILLATLISGMARTAPLPPAPFPAGDSNIVISNKTQRYIFDEGSKEHPVVIRQEDASALERQNHSAQSASAGRWSTQASGVSSAGRCGVRKP